MVGFDFKTKQYNAAHSSTIAGVSNVLLHISLIFMVIFLNNLLPDIFFLKLFSYVCSIFFIGTRMRALGNIIHECSHSTFVINRKHNKIIGEFLCLLEFGDFKKYKKDHFSHHRYLGDKDKDEDFKLRYLIGFFEFKSFKSLSFLKILFSPKNWFLLFVSGLSLNLNRYKLIFYVFYLIVFFVLFKIFGMVNLFLFILVPFLSTYQILKIFSDILDHGAIYCNKQTEFRSRNHVFKIKLLNLILFPRNDCYHLIHHLFPSLPTSKYAQKHKELCKTDPCYINRKHVIF